MPILASGHGNPGDSWNTLIADAENRNSLVLPLTTRLDASAMASTRSLMRTGPGGKFIEIENPLALAKQSLHSGTSSIGDPAKLNVALCVDSRGDNVAVKDSLARYIENLRMRGARICAFVGKGHCAAGSLLTQVPHWVAASDVTSFLWHPPVLTEHVHGSHGWLQSLFENWLSRNTLAPHRRQAIADIASFFESNLPRRSRLVVSMLVNRWRQW
ncbi:MAG: hypothetical protein PHZ00_05325 [Candidatus Peribacteraceae bacterium]|nr:hypothetical protein [Candidatus Peribacteraceae bacterium]